MIDSITGPEEKFQIKLTGFGRASYLDLQFLIWSSTNFLFFTSPEVFTREVCAASDVWSCGALLYLLLTGKTLFEAVSRKKLIKEICYTKVNFDRPECE
jgi:serine/threonine protein kinase